MVRVSGEQESLGSSPASIADVGQLPQSALLIVAHGQRIIPVATGMVVSFPGAGGAQEPMLRWKLIILLFLFGIGAAARADDVSCPTLTAAVQVAACPSDEELRLTFVGYCSDDARGYDLSDQDTSSTTRITVVGRTLRSGKWATSSRVTCPVIFLRKP